MARKIVENLSLKDVEIILYLMDNSKIEARHINAFQAARMKIVSMHKKAKTEYDSILKKADDVKLIISLNGDDDDTK